ncbi:MAG: hypothetical protein AAF823_10905 [Planctomycetota bacterium]
MLSDKVERPMIAAPTPAWLGRVLRVEWLGQTAASLCWMASVFAYGLGSTGDYLQLGAASAWLIANIAVALPAKDG